MKKYTTCIYKITSPSGKIYIGQTVDYKSRFNRHKYDSIRGFSKQPKLINSFNKYGFENHTFEIIEECTKEQLNKREIYWINFYDSYNKGLNCTIGGEGERNKPKIYVYNIDGTLKQIYDYNEYITKFNVNYHFFSNRRVHHLNGIPYNNEWIFKEKHINLLDNCLKVYNHKNKNYTVFIYDTKGNIVDKFLTQSDCKRAGYDFKIGNRDYKNPHPCGADTYLILDYITDLSYTVFICEDTLTGETKEFSNLSYLKNNYNFSKTDLHTIRRRLDGTRSTFSNMLNNRYIITKQHRNF